MIEKFIGNKSILTVIDLGKDKNVSSVEMVEVNYTDETIELMPKLRLEIISTEKISDLTKVQSEITKTIGGMIFAILNSYGVKMSEVPNILNYAEEQVNINYRRSRDILFGLNHEDLMINNINKIIEEDNAKGKDNNETSS